MVAWVLNMYFILTCRIHLWVWCWFLCSKITHKVLYCIQSCCMQHINTLAVILLTYVDIVVGAVWKYEPPPPKHHSCLSQTDSWWRNGKAGTHKSRLNCSIKAYGMVYPILFAHIPNITHEKYDSCSIYVLLSVLYIYIKGVSKWLQYSANSGYDSAHQN